MEFKVVDVKNVRHTHVGMIEMEVLFEHIGDFIPFAASPNDTVEHGRQLYKDAVEGKYGEIGEPEIHEDEFKSMAIRVEVGSTISRISDELSTLRDADELGIITKEEKVRYNDLRSYRIQATRFMNGDVLKGVRPVLPKN